MADSSGVNPVSRAAEAPAYKSANAQPGWDLAQSLDDFLAVLKRSTKQRDANA